MQDATIAGAPAMVSWGATVAAATRAVSTVTALSLFSLIISSIALSWQNSASSAMSLALKISSVVFYCRKKKYIKFINLKPRRSLVKFGGSILQ